MEIERLNGEMKKLVELQNMQESHIKRIKEDYEMLNDTNNDLQKENHKLSEELYKYKHPFLFRVFEKIFK